MKPPLSYFGSKWRCTEWICSLLPAHRVYVEVFGGSAAVLLTKPRSQLEVYNDVDGELVNFFRVLRERCEELLRLVSLTPYSREEYERSFEVTDDDLERARRFVVRSWQMFGGYHRRGASGNWRRDVLGDGNTSKAVRWAVGLPHRLRVVAKRLRGVQIERDDWRTTLSRYDNSETLFYCDPPYLGSTRKGSVGCYHYELESDEDHAALLGALTKLKGVVVLSGYASELYDHSLQGWKRFTRPTKSLLGGDRVECLWINRDAPRRSTQRELWG